MYTIKYNKKLKKAIKKIDSSKLAHIKNIIDPLKYDPQKGKKLTGRLKNYKRLIIDDYRITYEIINKEVIILIIETTHKIK